METHKITLGMVAAIFFLLSLGYYLIFDTQRENSAKSISDPEQEEGRKKKEQLIQATWQDKFSTLKSPQEIEEYFLQEILLGEVLLSRQSINKCVEHFGNAVIVCSKRKEFLHVLQQTLPMEVFNTLFEYLNNIIRSDER